MQGRDKTDRIWWTGGKGLDCVCFISFGVLDTFSNSKSIYICRPFHLEYWKKENNITKLSKVTESDEKTKDFEF